MSSYANPWNGNRQFYKGKYKTQTIDDEGYKKYCEKKKNKDKILSYEAWCKKERIKSGIF